MARRRNAAGNTITGPQSALTNFLAANNISAHQIRTEYEARVRAAEREAAEGQVTRDENVPDEPEEQLDEETPARRLTPEQKKKMSLKAFQKYREKKGLNKKKRKSHGTESDDSEGGAAWDMYTKKKPAPGQLDNCETCGKRFTVTPYSQEGDEGGLLCTKCSKEIKAVRKKEEKVKKPAISREKRRKAQSNLLDGLKPQGAKSLRDLCVEKVAENINDVDEFGDLPPSLLDRLSQILSKRRVMSARTMDLFLRPDLDTVALYDCAKLETEDFLKIFAVTPQLQHLTLENAGQFKSEVLDYIMERDVPLRTLKLEAANLISDEKWREFFGRAGRRLEVLKLTWLDYAMDDETFAHLIDGCPNLTYLKIKKCFRLTAASLKLISKLEKLEHLSLLVANTADQETLLDLIRSVGRNLRVLSLERFDNADDQVLQEINANCVKLHKLRFSANDFCTDAGFQALFEGWKNPGLSYVDFSECRDIDHDAPDGPEDDPVGLASGGFEALMAHSGLKLERLNIKSCRHISHAALTHVFDGKQRYPSLKEIDLSFVKSVDTLVMAGIFKSCPAIEKVTAFSCFNIKDVVVPAGVALIGVPNAQDSIVQEGRFLGDIMMQDYC